MSSTDVTNLDDLKRDLSLRGYDEAEIQRLMKLPILLIPGPVTIGHGDKPIQNLTNHLVFLSKDLQRNAISNEVAIRKDIPRKYIEERQAHIDLGTIVVGVVTLQQLGAFANVAQILDFLLNLIQFKFSKGRTDQLMPNVKFKLVAQNGKKMLGIDVEGRADDINKIVSPKRLEIMLAHLQDTTEDESSN